MDAELPVDGDVLLVDDEPLVGEMMASQIRLSGRVCHLVDSYQSALRELRRNPAIGLVILDHGIQPSGLQAFVERVRCEHAQTTLVGNSGRDCRDEFASAGVQRFLQKPWTLSELGQVLQRPAPRDSVSAAGTDATCISRPLDVSVGERCRPIGRDLAALEGIVEETRSSGRVTIRLDGQQMLGVFLEIDADAIEHAV